MTEANLINENKLGAALGTEVEDHVNKNFAGETEEVGLYLAMSRQAEREGFPEVAAALRAFGLDEAEHAAHFAESEVYHVFNRPFMLHNARAVTWPP